MTIELHDIGYRLPGADRPLIDAANHRFASGTVTAITGPSGSGKTTLLSLLTLLVPFDTGDILFDGMATAAMAADDRERFRCQQIGVLFQTMRVLARLTVDEQIDFAAGNARDPASIRRRGQRYLQRLGLAGLHGHLPDQLSGGQQARLAMTLCLMRDVRFVLADEPTAALDAAASRLLMDLLRECARERDCVCVLATHDPLAIEAADEVLTLDKC
ncbi:MAG: ATP-binding cassette domain-containing protein [Pseudomonadota bacterium]